MAVNQVSSQKTIQQIIDQSSSKTTARNTGDLGKNDFLNLMVTQLRYQDPLNPTDDKEFIGQMAQFSSLEQMQNMNTSLSSVKAFNLIGKHVSASVVDPVTKQTKAVTGEVTSVKMDKGNASVIVNGQDIPIDQITDATNGFGSAQSNISQFTNLIGYNVDGAVYDTNTGDIVAVNGTVKSIAKGLNEDFAVMDGVKVKFSELYGQEPTTDPNYMKNYLSTNEGKPIDVYILDTTTGKKVPITGTLQKGWTIGTDSIVNATLDGVNVPVASASNVTPAQVVKEVSNEEKLLQQILDKLTPVTPTPTTTTGG